MIYAILLFGLDIVVGYTGQVSLGHAGLFGIGAYAAGVLVHEARRAARWSTLAGIAIGVTAAVRRGAGAAGAARDRARTSRW